MSNRTFTQALRDQLTAWQDETVYLTAAEITKLSFSSRECLQECPRVRKREVAEDRWRNPALDPEAQRKLSRPRKHGDDPVLHAAIEKLGRGMSMADLTPEEQETYRAHRRGLRRARGDQVRAYRRRRYSEEMATEEGRAKRNGNDGADAWRNGNRIIDSSRLANRWV